MRTAPQAPRVEMLASLDELLGRLKDRRPFKTADSLSGSGFEAARYQSEPVVLKYLCLDDDWLMRAAGDIDCRALRLFGTDLLQWLPHSIDHAVRALAPYPSAHGHRSAAMLLRDVHDTLVPPGAAPIQLDQHLRFIGHMAAMHAAFWAWEDSLELLPLAHHYLFLVPAMAQLEAQRGSGDPVPIAVARGWTQLEHAAPAIWPVLRQLADDPAPLVEALAQTPQTLVHGDWKLGNLGEHPDGRTVLLDWDRCGRAPCTLDLAWYLAVNCDRLPQSKEATIAAYREALEAEGITTAAWWDSQLRLTLLGAALQLCWSKVDDAAELGWWAEQVREAEPWLA